MDKLFRNSVFIFCLLIGSMLYAHQPLPFSVNIEYQEITSSVSGVILDAEGNPVENAYVYLDANLPEYPRTRATNENGEYVFYNVPQGNDYTIRVEKNEDPLQDVSTLDFVYILRNILGLENYLDNPNKIIAADINADNTINVFDIFQLRKIILGVVVEFPSNESYRFLDASHEFSDPENPWPDADNYPYVIQFTLTEDATFNFTGIKIGHVNF